MKIAIGSDEAGFELKNQVKGYLEGKGCKVVDVGCHSNDPVLYPDVAESLCKKIIDGTCERGVLVCGTGIGMAMTANKMPGIRAFGARVVSYVYVTRMLDIWLSLEFKDGSSTPKVDEMCAIERRHAQDER